LKANRSEFDFVAFVAAISLAHILGLGGCAKDRADYPAATKSTGEVLFVARSMSDSLTALQNPAPSFFLHFFWVL
jgi:hypothetical protein